MRTLIFDTETTGLVGNIQLSLEHQPRVTEFYGHLVTISGNRWDMVEELDFLCNPGVRLTDEIIAITNITNEMLVGKPTFAKFMPQVNKLLASADLVVAHNLNFDKTMLQIEAKRLGVELAWPPMAVCTVEATEHIRGHRLKLGELYSYLFERQFDGAHRAKTDVHALTDCWAELLDRGTV